MNKEDKEFLVKDLCARLPYGVKTITYIPHLEGGGETVERTLDSMSIDKLRGASLYPNEKPYLRPMSSMTEDERKEYNDIVKNTIDFYVCPKSEEICFFAIPIDWLNSHHFDYRGLIEKGLAIAVTKENNPYDK